MKLLIFLTFFSLSALAIDTTPTKSDAVAIQAEAEEVKNKEASPTTSPIALKEERRDIFNVTAYEPIYFVYHNRSTKVQASFKYRLHRQLNWYASYTHLILWDWNSKSKPFLDQNYNPSLFYRMDKFKKDGLFESVDLIPYEHISNGKEAAESRSVDALGAQFNFRYSEKSWVARAGVRARYWWNIESQNEDFRKYRGPFELRLALTQFSRSIFDKGEITARLFSGGDFGEDFTKGGQEIGISFRILGLEITPAFYLQFYHGYSESMRFYNQKENIVRFGLLL